MILAIILLLVALGLSGVAGYYSVMGMIAIFSAAWIPIAIMTSLLEVSKIVLASWLYQNWKITPILLRSYFIGAIVVLMMITCLGIFGFLSKSHADQSLISGDVQAKLAIFDQKIQTAKDDIASDHVTIKQLDTAVDQIMGRSTDSIGAQRAINVRKSQKSERDRLNSDIEIKQNIISQLNESSAPIRAASRKVEAEVGPIKYVAALVGGSNEKDLDKAVRYVILMIIVVFDPLAVLMIVAANMSFKQSKIENNDPLLNRFRKSRDVATQGNIDSHLDNIDDTELSTLFGNNKDEKIATSEKSAIEQLRSLVNSPTLSRIISSKNPNGVCVDDLSDDEFIQLLIDNLQAEETVDNMSDSVVELASPPVYQPPIDFKEQVRQQVHQFRVDRETGYK